MQTRREFLARSISAPAAVSPLAGCSGTDMDDYEEAAARLRAARAEDSDVAALIRFATLAPNGHNTQPWRFAIADPGVAILPDLSRRTPIVDPDDHHLYVSLGCAAETLAIAAAAHGRRGTVAFDEAGDGRVVVELGRGPARAGALYGAIPARQSTRSDYDGRKVSAEDLKRLETAAASEGVSVALITDDARRAAFLDYVVAGNSAQMDDPAFVRELKDWLRFNPAEALRTGDGLFSACSGHPTMPTWIGRTLLGWFLDKDTENEKYAGQLRSSAGVAVFIGDAADRDHWVRVGRSFQRFALQATALGIRHAHVNQPVEVPSVRSEFAHWLGVGDRRPDLVVRFGYAPPLPMSMRRPVEAVIVAAD